jgi:hypothetical protein
VTLDRTIRRRRCKYCGESFLPTPDKPCAKQCDYCRTGEAAPFERHTHEWDKRSLGLIESNVLRRAWGSKRSDNATEN